MLAGRRPLVVGQAQHLSGTQMDEQVCCGREVVDPAFEGCEASGIVGVGAEPVDPALVGEFCEGLLQGVARELVEALRRGERIEAPQEDAQESHERIMRPVGMGAWKVFYSPPLGVWEIALGSGRCAEWRVRNVDFSCREKRGKNHGREFWKRRRQSPRSPRRRGSSGSEYGQCKRLECSGCDRSAWPWTPAFAGDADLKVRFRRLRAEPQTQKRRASVMRAFSVLFTLLY